MEYLNKTFWVKNSDGINYADGNVTATAFSDETEEKLLRLEDDSWWFNYRADVITGLMLRFMQRERLTVDIGGGNAFTSGKAGKMGFKTAIIEPSPAACRNALSRGIGEVNCGAVTDVSVLDESIEQALLLDVLEHIEDDDAFIKLLYKKMKSKGRLLITVPAFMSLWSSEDEVAGHFRRYRIRELCALLRKNGFKVAYASYFMGFLYLPILIIRVWMEKVGLIKKQQDRTEKEREKIADSQFKSKSTLVTKVLSVLFKLEKRLLKRPGRVPFGSSIIVVARRR